MKNLIYLVVCFQVFFISICASSSESEKILAEVVYKMDAVPLPDGCSIFGRHIIDTVRFDIDHLGTKGAEAHRTAINLMYILKNPVKSSSVIWGDTYYSVEEIMSMYISLVKTLYTLTPDTVVFFEGLYKYGQTCGTQIPGFDINTPISKVRHDLFKVLGNWRVHGEASKADAIEAIRIERERLAAIIAEEETKHKAAAEAKTSEEVRIETSSKTTETTSTLRHRKGHKPTATPGLDDADKADLVTAPLLTPHGKPVRAH